MIEVILSIGVGLFYALIVIFAGLSTALISAMMSILVFWLMESGEGGRISQVAGDASVRYAFVLSIPFSVLGVAVGLLSGLSRVPVVGSVIPSVLTLLAGAATLLFAKGQKEAQIALVAMISVSLALVVGTVIGAGLRPT